MKYSEVAHLSISILVHRLIHVCILYRSILLTEAYNKFTHYRNRFSMPGMSWPMPVDKLWYSFNIGKAHFIRYFVI